MQEGWLPFRDKKKAGARLNYSTTSIRTYFKVSNKQSRRTGDRVGGSTGYFA